MAQQIILRRGTASEWSAVGTSVVLAAAEVGVETDTGKFKIGNGVGVWNDLGYASPTALNNLTDVSDVAATVGQVLAWNGTIWAADDLPTDLDTTYRLSAETDISGTTNIRLTDSNSIVVDAINIAGAGTVSVDRFDANTVRITGTQFDTVDNTFTGTTSVQELNVTDQLTTNILSASTGLIINSNDNVLVRSPNGTVFGSASLGINGVVTQVFNSSTPTIQTVLHSHNSPDVGFNQWSRSRGTTDAPEIVQNNDMLGSLRFSGYNGTNYNFGAAITVRIDGTPSVGDQIATKMLFATNNGIVPSITAVLGPTGIWQVNQIQALAPNGNLEFLNNGTGIVQLPTGSTVGGVPIGSISITGTVADQASLPVQPIAAGTAYVVSSPAPSHLWVSDGATWVDLGEFQGPAGADGVDGAPGANGTDGVGVPVGGTIGQILAKISATDYATEWINNVTYDQSLNTGSTVQFNSVQTAADTASMIPFYYPTLAGLPAASTSHGAVAHAHDTGKLYYAHAGVWIELANYSELPTSIFDLGIVDGTVGQVLTTDGAGGLIFATASGAALGALNDLSDVVVDTPAIGQVLKYNGTNWVNETDNSSVGFARQSVSGSTGSLANGAVGPINIVGFKSYTLLKVQTSAAAWVRIYVSEAARQADAARTEGVDPLPGAGIIAEVITTGAETVLITPGAIGFNDETPVTTNIPLRVTNKSGDPANITVTLTAVQLEV